MKFMGEVRVKINVDTSYFENGPTRTVYLNVQEGSPPGVNTKF